MPRRMQTGNRDRLARFTRHNGKTHPDSGLPTYDVESDWEDVLTRYPCEKLTARGGEVLRGRQVTDQTVCVLWGDYWAPHRKKVDVDCRCEVDGVRYGVNAVYDQDGERFEMRVELKLEK